MSQGQGNKTVEGKKGPSPTRSALADELKFLAMHTPEGMDTSSDQPGDPTAQLRMTAARRLRRPETTVTPPAEAPRAEGQPPVLQQAPRVEGQPAPAAAAAPAPWVARAEGQAPVAQAPREGKDTKQRTVDLTRREEETPDICWSCRDPLHDDRQKIVPAPCGFRKHRLHLECALPWQNFRRSQGDTKLHCPTCQKPGPFYEAKREPTTKGAMIYNQTDMETGEAVAIPLPIVADDMREIEPEVVDTVEYEKTRSEFKTKNELFEARMNHGVKSLKAARKAYHAQIAAVAKYRKALKRQAYLNMLHRLFEEERLYELPAAPRPSRAAASSSSSSSSREASDDNLENRALWA